MVDRRDVVPAVFKDAQPEVADLTLDDEQDVQAAREKVKDAKGLGAGEGESKRFNTSQD